ncbi:MAG: winged helix-turn-helix domain-containing protein [Halobacteria archaeon]
MIEVVMFSSEELRKWQDKMFKEGKIKDWKTDHERGLDATANRTRRAILGFIGFGKSFEEIKQHFNLSEALAKYHLEVLEQALFVEKQVRNGKIYYALTPRGAGFCDHVSCLYRVEEL